MSGTTPRKCAWTSRAEPNLPPLIPSCTPGIPRWYKGTFGNIAELHLLCNIYGAVKPTGCRRHCRRNPKLYKLLLNCQECCHIYVTSIVLES